MTALPICVDLLARIPSSITLYLVIIISVIFSLPPNELVLWTIVGLAIVQAKQDFVGPTKTDETGAS